MKAVVIHGPGGYDKLSVETLPDPAPPKAGEVAIDVRAAGINYADVVIRMGFYKSQKELVGWPVTPGFEAAGVVTAVGDGVTRVKPGDPVFAGTLFGGYASKLTLPQDQVFPLPEGWTFEQAAGFPTVYLTAYYSLFELAHPRAGSSILIHSASGGVGLAMTQLAKIAGCAPVVGIVGSPHKVALARENGCDEVIDKSSENLWRRAEAIAPKGFDVVTDATGPQTLGESYRHTATAGKLVCFGFSGMMPRQGGRVTIADYPKLAWEFFHIPRFNPMQLTMDNKSVLAFNLSFLFEKKYLLVEAIERMMAWTVEGRIRPAPVKAYPIERVADAHRDIESGKTTGKLVLTTA